MRKIIVSNYATLDGKAEDLREWVAPYDTDWVVAYHTALLENADGMIMGRATYEAFAALWPSRAGRLAYVDKINSVAKYVASTTLSTLTWENSHLIEGDLVQAVDALKRQEGGDLVVFGSFEVTGTLLENGLVDEYRALVYPVLLGKGRSLLGDGGKRVDLELVSTTVIPSGVAILTYRPVR